MFDTNTKLDVSCKELDLIESALETQSKILQVQVNAGTEDVLGKLNDVKRLLTQIDNARPKRKCCTSTTTSWLSFLRPAS
ncbi:hypothetical protein C1J03_16620 [Sulfitobacter sp. SK012]|uniref:hypothetical protein n=1 Tax=Sulfitobacter sp. SK012 TaxID=1389005 RepID=UPI000E0C303F|nr:hypothetical protein [Sulfitobacter sp. SK012]AXI47485.1 hypothetical protein C1J03_16620 [Sulfitobacter sp. SK012]